MTGAGSPRIYKFERFELHHAERRLLESGSPVTVSARAFDVLAALIKREGLASKKELLQEVWPGLVVEENTLQAQVSSLRKILGPQSILTVSGRGYRFAMAVTVIDVEDVSPPLEDNLPRPITSFIGRVREIADVKRLLSRSRCLTIVGSGGCGKTRLALQVAIESRSTTTRRICFVDVAAASDGTSVAQRLASVLGLAEHPGEDLIDDIAQSLDVTRALVVFDNAEHLRLACGALVDELLTRSAAVSFLVTSRERLDISGELTYRVSSLPVPGMSTTASPESFSGCESVDLFVDRARILRPHFAVTASNVLLVASLCRRLAGIPLAIELVAPRLRSMSLEEVDEQLDRHFRASTDGSDISIPPQYTLRSVIDWTFELLIPAEQAVLRRASLFAAGWDLQSAEVLCAGDGVDPYDMLDILVSLADKHLVSTEQRNGFVRYRMPTSLRRYALGRLRAAPEDFESRRVLHLSHLKLEAGRTGHEGSRPRE